MTGLPKDFVNKKNMDFFAVGGGGPRSIRTHRLTRKRTATTGYPEFRPLCVQVPGNFAPGFPRHIIQRSGEVEIPAPGPNGSPPGGSKNFVPARPGNGAGAKDPGRKKNPYIADLLGWALKDASEGRCWGGIITATL